MPVTESPRTNCTRSLPCHFGDKKGRISIQTRSENRMNFVIDPRDPWAAAELLRRVSLLTDTVRLDRRQSTFPMSDNQDSAPSAGRSAPVLSWRIAKGRQGVAAESMDAAAMKSETPWRDEGRGVASGRRG
jgi:hypothetical protein